jgi:putative peptidoglycan lipid II flippase
MINKLFNSQVKSITFGAFLLGVSAFFSRILGLVRDRLLAGKFGVSQELDIYFSAFRLPDFVYGIFISGGIVAVFLPLFSEYFQKNPQKAWQFTNNLLNCFLFLLILICGILTLFTPLIIKFLVPGFSKEHQALTITLTRIMFLSPILLGISSIFSGILQYFQRFFVYSLAPIFYNLGIIFGILFFVPFLGILGLAWGVILGAFLHLLIQIPLSRNLGYRYLAIFNFHSLEFKKVLKLILPRSLGVIAYHINLIVITALASTLFVGSITIFNFANNLQYLPVAIFGISFALSAFPALSKSWAAQNKERFLESFSLTFSQIVFLVLPISFLIFLLRVQIVRIILGTEEFGWWETRLTAATLGIFALGILAFSLLPLIVRAFFAFQDTKTPFLAGILAMGLNIAFCFFFVWFLSFSNFFQSFLINFLKLQGINNLQILGLPLALSLSGIFQIFFLLIFLYQKIGDFKIKKIWQSFQKTFFSSLIMAILVYFLLRLGAIFFNLQTFFGIFFQFLLAFLGGILIYIGINIFFKSRELQLIKAHFFR